MAGNGAAGTATVKASKGKIHLDARRLCIRSESFRSVADRRVKWVTIASRTKRTISAITTLPTRIPADQIHGFQNAKERFIETTSSRTAKRTNGPGARSILRATAHKRKEANPVDLLRRA